MSTGGLICGLSIFLGCLIMIKYNIIKQVLLALFFTGLIQILVSGCCDIITLAVILVFCNNIIQANEII